MCRLEDPPLPHKTSCGCGSGISLICSKEEEEEDEEEDGYMDGFI